MTFISVATILPNWIERGNFQNFLGPSTAIQCQILRSFDHLSACVLPNTSDFIHFTIPSIRRYIPCEKSIIIIIIVFGRLLVIFP